MRVFVSLLFLFSSAFVFAQEIHMESVKASVSFVFLESGTEGTIEGVETSIKLDFSDISGAAISGKAKVNTLTTKNKLRDKHLKGKDFFHAKKYPEITFTSEEVAKVKDRYLLKGSLTIKETTKEVVFVFRQQSNQLIFETTINAMDFDISPKKETEKSNVNVKIIVSII